VLEALVETVVYARPVRLSSVATGLAALAVAGGATAAIVPQQQIHGVTVGMSAAQVRAKLGKPTKVTHGRNDFGKWTAFHYPGLSINFQSGTGATAIATLLRGQRTARGVGVGSTIAAVKTNVPGAKCVTEFGLFHCYVGRWEPGRIVTDFSIAKGHVSRVTLGRVLD